MRHTDDDIADAAEQFERWAEQVDPDEVDVENIDDLRAVADAADAVAAAQARLREAVEIARARGRSWNRIAIPLGTSRQAARQRFEHPAPSGQGEDDDRPAIQGQSDPVTVRLDSQGRRLIVTGEPKTASSGTRFDSTEGLIMTGPAKKTKQPAKKGTFGKKAARGKQ